MWVGWVVILGDSLSQRDRDEEQLQSGCQDPDNKSDGDGILGLSLRLLRFGRLVRLAGRLYRWLRWRQVIGWR